MHQPRRRLVTVAASLSLLASLVLAGGCPGSLPESAVTALTPSDTFPSSLHFTRSGKAFFYSAAAGGFETLTNVPMTSLGCQKCHDPNGRPDGSTVNPATYLANCCDCHLIAGDVVAQETCLGCHSRQANEIKLAAGDVHRDLGYTCMNCHTSQEMHGDGTDYVSMRSPGAIQASCDMEGCHTQVADNVYHEFHLETHDCSACHVQTVISCYNCHFDSEVAGVSKRFFKPPLSGFTMLVRAADSGKVRPATFQSLVYQGQTFYTIAPYYAHTVAKNARVCGDCHGNAAVQEYRNTGLITVAEWIAGALTGPTGVIPVPPDWETALQFDFLNYNGDPADPATNSALWGFLKTGADLRQMLFAQPLTAEQMQRIQ